MSKLSDAAYVWLRANKARLPVSSDDLWAGLQKQAPELTAVTQTRKTPRNTLMRDMRLDKKGRFRIQDRRISLAERSEG